MMLHRIAVLLGVLGFVGAARLRSQGLRKRPQGAYKQTLYNKQNMQYHADFVMGGQTIQGIFDTGSFELVVRSSRCTACKHPTAPYDHTKSKTYQYNGSQVQHVYGSGPCVSLLGYDDICVGNMCAPRQAFWEIVQHQIPVLDQATFAAIVGIGPQFGYGNQEKTLLMSYGIEEFSVCLQRESGANGVLNWGAIASEETKRASFISVPSIGSHHWTATMTDIYFGPKGGPRPAGHEVICKPGECAAVVDSGTSLIAAPTALLMKLSMMIPPIQEDCSNLHDLPTLHLSMGDGNQFTLPPSAYVMRIKGGTLQANSVWDILFFKPKVRKQNMCMPAFMQMDMPSDEGLLWILGMPFFRYYHTSFDRKNKAMHFANAGPGCEPTPLTGNHSASLLTMQTNAADFEPFDVDLDYIIPPTFGFTLNKDKTQKVEV